MSELVKSLRFLSRKEQRLVAALDFHGALSHEILLDLGYDIENSPSSIRNLNAAIRVLNQKMPQDLQLIRAVQASTELGLNPLILFSRDLHPGK
jgi:hypothetical protein